MKNNWRKLMIDKNVETEFVCFAGHEDCPIASDGVGEWSPKYKGYLCPRCNCFTSELDKSPDELMDNDDDD
jgi:hypothetical protein